MIPKIYQAPPMTVKSFEEVHKLFVQPFAASKTRQNLWDSLMKLTDYINKYEYLHYIDTMYLDGDFISQSSNPDYLNVFIVYNFHLISTEKDLEDFTKWRNDLSKVCITLFKGIKLVTSLSHIDTSDPDLLKFHRVCTKLITQNLEAFASVPHDSSLSKTYLILDNFKI